MLLYFTCFVYVVRLELENRLAALEQQRALQDTTGQAQKEEWEDRLRSAQQGEESVRRELQGLRSVAELCLSPHRVGGSMIGPLGLCEQCLCLAEALDFILEAVFSRDSSRVKDHACFFTCTRGTVLHVLQVTAS